MARKVVTHVVERDNRDKGKTFVITEMSAVQAHKWATKALFAILNTGVEMPDELAKMGIAGMAVMGMGSFGNVPYAVAEPLLNELLACVQIKEALATRNLVDEDFEEAITIFDLQAKVFGLHTDPFISGARPTSASQPTTPSAAD